MRYPSPIIVAGIALAAAAPLMLHERGAPDCNPTVELCSISDAMYLPDEQAPMPAPQLTVAPPVAGSTVSAPSSAVLDYPIPSSW